MDVKEKGGKAKRYFEGGNGWKGEDHQRVESWNRLNDLGRHKE